MQTTRANMGRIFSLPKFALLPDFTENPTMIGSNPANHNKLIGWTFLILIVTVFLFSYSFLRKSGPVPNEEMQLREAEQRAHQFSDEK
jgi:hypothetical protein